MCLSTASGLVARLQGNGTSFLVARLREASVKVLLACCSYARHRRMSKLRRGQVFIAAAGLLSDEGSAGLFMFGVSYLRIFGLPRVALKLNRTHARLMRADGAARRDGLATDDRPWGS